MYIRKNMLTLLKIRLFNMPDNPFVLPFARQRNYRNRTFSLTYDDNDNTIL